MANSYIEENRWFITASKLKYFLEYWPEAYKLKFIDEVQLEEEDKKCFTLWTALDDLLSYGRKFFEEKYYIDEWLLLEELKARIWKENLHWKEKKDELLEIMYWDRIRLTKSDWENILWAYKECMRQPLVDMWSDYLHQEVIEIEFEWMPLRMKLDRLSIEKQLLRDWKTSWQIDRFERNMESKFWYILSMAFYYIWAKVKYNVSCDVILDVLWVAKPYPYIWYMLEKKDLFYVVENKIKPWLRALKECMDSWIRESVYPIDYQTENKYWDIISYTKWEPIARTKLMNCDTYWLLKGSIQEKFVSPNY